MCKQTLHNILIWMTELLLGRLLQPLVALTTTVYSSPHCRSVQLQEVVLVRHWCVSPSRPVASALYASAPSLGPQLTELRLFLHSTEVVTLLGIHGAVELGWTYE